MSDEAVRAQYESYPYPARDPGDERRRLVSGSPSHPLEIDHYLFAGRRDWSRPFRALVAGGGTGDATIMLAQGLADRGCPAEIVYLDVSTASRRIAEERARVRCLANIRFETGSLLDAASLGRFDYIDCCGVLHHLADPAEGLKALAAALYPDGGMGVMVYGALGRTGVYPAQDALRALGAGLADKERVDLARRFVKDLPASNWLRLNPHLADHLSSDAGLYDLLLHSRDRAYRVPEVFGLLGAAGLRLVSFIEELRYEPETWLADPVLKRRAAVLPTTQRPALAEALCGSCKVHVLYAVHAGRSDDTVARLDPDAIAVMRDMEAGPLARGMKPGARLSSELGGVKLSFAMPPLAGPILERVDGRRSFEEIRTALLSPPEPDPYMRQVEQLYRVLGGLNRMKLRFAGAGRR